MAFKDSFKKFMGMSPLDDGIEEDDEEIGDVLEGSGHGGFGFNADMSKMNKLDELDHMGGFGGTTTFSTADPMDSFTREEPAKVVNLHQGGQPQVVLVKPERFEEATSIADHLQAKRTVVVNTDSMSPDVRRRLIDFLSGVAYAENGTIKQASNTTFVMTPNNVGVMGDSIVEEGEQEAGSGSYY